MGFHIIEEENLAYVQELIEEGNNLDLHIHPIEKETLQLQNIVTRMIFDDSLIGGEERFSRNKSFSRKFKILLGAERTRYMRKGFLSNLSRRFSERQLSNISQENPYPSFDFLNLKYTYKDLKLLESSQESLDFACEKISNLHLSGDLDLKGFVHIMQKSEKIANKSNRKLFDQNSLLTESENKKERRRINFLEKIEQRSINRACDSVESFYKSIDRLIEEQKSHEICKSLLLEEKRQKKPSQKKAKVRGKKKRVVSSYSSEETCSSEESSVQISKEEKTNAANISDRRAQNFILHPRVLRWQAARSLQEIRFFSDKLSGEIVRPYQSLSEKELLWQKRRHNLAEVVENILSNPDYEGLYYFPTDRGYGLAAELREGGESSESEFGYVYLGVDKASKVVYHCFFEPLESLNRSKRQIISSPQEFQKIKESINMQAEYAWEIQRNRRRVSDCRFFEEPMQNSEKPPCLRLEYADGYQLRIYPLQRREEARA